MTRCWTAVAIALIAVPVAAQDATDPPENTTPPARLPTLDELLGLEPAPAESETADDNSADRSPPAAIPDSDRPDDAPDPTRAELDRALAEIQPTDEVRRAVALMEDAAARLDRGLTDISTQRLQEEILRRLDQAIDALRNNQQQSSSSSSSSSSSQQQQQQQRQQQQQTGSDEQASGEPGERDAPPGAQDAQLNERLEASRAAWGALPARTRDALLQGSSDSFSSLYRQLTEDFYRRLAEEAR